MLNKAQVVKQFKEDILPLIKSKYEQDRRIDYPARREAWNNYTDALRTDGRISEHAYDNWLCPW
jgi:hypothetical protein